MDKKLLFALLLTLLTFAAGCAARTPQTSSGPANTLQTELEEAMQLAADNAPQLTSFINHYPEGSPQKRAALFMVRNMPLSDLSTLSTADLIENHSYAFLARKIFPWSAAVSWDDFLSFTLPWRVSQEPFQPFRAKFFKELAPLAANCTTAVQAALVVNKWCFEKVQYKPTSWRDLGPLSVLERGIGRCEEKNILFIAAARTIGIPARQCIIPLWQHTDSNHAWVEIWTGQKWAHLDAGAMQDSLNSAGFEQSAKQAPLAISFACGHHSETGSKIYRSGPGYTLLNTTADYAPTGIINVLALDRNGQPIPGAKIYVSVYNGGSIRPMAKIICNTKGKGSLEAGYGTYFVSMMHSGIFSSRLINCAKSFPTETILATGSDSELKSMYVFELPVKPDIALPEISPEIKKIYEDLDMKRKKQELDQQNLADLFFSKEPQSQNSTLARQIRQTGAKIPEFIQTIQDLPHENISDFSAFISYMNTKDLVECNPGQIPGLIANARQTCVAKSWFNQSDPGELFYNYAAGNRIYREPWQNWRPELKNAFSKWKDLPPRKLALKIQNFVFSLQTGPANIFGNALTAKDILKSGNILGERDRSLMAVAIFRVLGVPARYQPDWQRTEYFAKGDWQALKTEKKETEDDSAKIEVVMHLGLSQKMKDEDKQPEYFKDLTVSRINPKGYIEALQKINYEFDPAASTANFELLPGDYLLILGQREAEKTFVNVISFKADSNSGSQVAKTSSCTQ